MALRDQELHDVVEAIRRKDPDGRGYEKALEIAMRDPSDAFDLASALLVALPEGHVVYDAVISYVSDSRLADLARDAVRRLGSLDSDLRKSGAAAATISYTSLQAPGLLAQHLDEIWRLRPNAGTYYEMWPWRGANPDKSLELLNMCNDRKAPAEVRMRAWKALLETRQPEVLAKAVAASAGLQSSLRNTVPGYLHQVGYDLDGDNTFRRITPEVVVHLQFPVDYFRDSGRPVWVRRSTHPSWRPTAAALGTAAVGGNTDAGCAICGRQLMRLIELEEGLPKFGVASRHRLEIVICDFCVSYSPVVFYSHDTSGSPRSLPGEKPSGFDEWDPVSLAPVEVELVHGSARWERQDWALSNGRENLYRVGGEPTWIQSAEFRLCPQCGVRMPFLFQFDSDVPVISGGEWSCGAGSGIVYVFWCDSCAISGASIQDT